MTNSSHRTWMSAVARSDWLILTLLAGPSQLFTQQDVARELLYSFWLDCDFSHNYIMARKTWQDRCLVYDGRI